MLRLGPLPSRYFNIWIAWRMKRLIEKVTSPPSPLQAAHSFTDFFAFVYVALTAKLEAVEKALANERAARLITDQSLADVRATRQAVDQSLQASQEANAALNRDLRSTQAFIIATREKLSSKSAALD
jgi:hypothetical protein